MAGGERTTITRATATSIRNSSIIGEKRRSAFVNSIGIVMQVVKNLETSESCKL